MDMEITTAPQRIKLMTLPYEMRLKIHGALVRSAVNSSSLDLSSITLEDTDPSTSPSAIARLRDAIIGIFLSCRQCHLEITPLLGIFQSINFGNVCSNLHRQPLGIPGYYLQNITEATVDVRYAELYDHSQHVTWLLLKSLPKLKLVRFLRVRRLGAINELEDTSKEYLETRAGEDEVGRRAVSRLMRMHCFWIKYLVDDAQGKYKIIICDVCSYYPAAGGLGRMVCLEPAAQSVQMTNGVLKVLCARS
jgi:hypothetical protein